MAPAHRLVKGLWYNVVKNIPKSGKEIRNAQMVSRHPLAYM